MPKFGDFNSIGILPAEPENEIILQPKLKHIKKNELHLKSHGAVWYYPGHGHICPKDECIINNDPKSLLSIFDAMDRKEWK